jgi:hypothetical protein
MNYKLKEKIQNNNLFTIFTSEDFSQHDELGFDILHYALLFGSDSVVSKVLKKKDLLPKPVINVFFLAYDYSYIATILGRDNFVEQLSNVSVYVRDSLRCYEQLNKNKKVLDNTIRSERRRAENYRKSTRTNQSINKSLASAKIKQINDLIRVQSRFIALIEDDIIEAENTVSRCRSLYASKLDEFKKSSTSAPGIVKLILYYYKNWSDYDYSDHKIDFYFCGYNFLISEKWFKQFIPSSENNNHRDNSNKHTDESANSSYQSKDNSEEDIKPHGNHWFSKEAWNNIDALRKEYRTLAKKYHPDNHPEKIRTFMSIQSERSVILERLKNI